MKEHAVVTKCRFSIKQVKVWMKDYNIICIYINYKYWVDTSANAEVKNQLGVVGYEHSWPTGLTPA